MHGTCKCSSSSSLGNSDVKWRTSRPRERASKERKWRLYGSQSTTPTSHHEGAGENTGAGKLVVICFVESLALPIACERLSGGFWWLHACEAPILSVFNVTWFERNGDFEFFTGLVKRTSCPFPVSALYPNSREGLEDYAGVIYTWRTWSFLYRRGYTD